jgi:hypothetical protein
MCEKMCILSRKLYNEGIAPHEEAHEANKGAMCHVSSWRYVSCGGAGEFISTHMIDGGTEGFMGKVIYFRPGYNACYKYSHDCMIAIVGMTIIVIILSALLFVTFAQLHSSRRSHRTQQKSGDLLCCQQASQR